MLRALSRLKPIQQPMQMSVRYNFPLKYYDMLRLQPQAEVTRLCNGLTVATEPREGSHACVGLFIDGGSRYESNFENGIAHFFEHIAFKGTNCRTPQTLADQMSCTGARFKSFTTREMVGYYAECRCEDLPIITDLLADCVFNNSYSQNEIEKQKEIVYHEMMELDEDPNATLFDYLHGAAFHGTSLAHSVIGVSSNLYNFSTATMCQYIAKMFDPTRTVLATVGAVTHAQMLELANLYMGCLHPYQTCTDEEYRFSGADFRYRNDALPLCNVALAFEGPSLADDDAYTMDVAAMFLGGWDRSQLCGNSNANLIARAGYYADLCSAYKGFNIKYKNTGLWGVQFMAKRDELDNSMYNIQSEFMRLCTMITKNEVDRAKRELKTRLLTKLEGATGACVDLGRYTLYAGRRPALHERLAEIERVYEEDVMAACQQYVYDRCPAVAAVGPCESLPDYTVIRSAQYWLRT